MQKKDGSVHVLPRRAQRRAAHRQEDERGMLLRIDLPCHQAPPSPGSHFCPFVLPFRFVIILFGFCDFNIVQRSKLPSHPCGKSAVCRQERWSPPGMGGPGCI